MNILLVDDDANVLKAFSKGLALLGHEVTTAFNGRHALDILPQCCPDVVITDIFMPEMDGFEFIKALQDRTPWIPIIVLSGGGSGMSSDLFLRISEKMGVFRALSKPCSISEVAMAVDTCRPAGQDGSGHSNGTTLIH